MRAALRSELRKLLSTRLWWVLLLAMAAYLVFIGATLGLALALGGDVGESGGAPVLGGVDAATTVYSLVSAIGYVFPLVVGSLAVTTEFRHHTITQTLLAEPRRGVLLAAKLLATVPVGLLYGVVGALAIVLGGAPALAVAGDGAFLTDGDVVEVLLLDVLVTVLWALLGAAFGLLVTQQVAAIVIILAFTQFVEPVARLALGAVDALAGVAAFLPGAAADALIGASFFGELGSGDLLPRWAGALVLLAYIAVFATIGRLTTLRRDVA